MRRQQVGCRIGSGSYLGFAVLAHGLLHGGADHWEFGHSFEKFYRGHLNQLDHLESEAASARLKRVTRKSFDAS